MTKAEAAQKRVADAKKEYEAALKEADVLRMARAGEAESLMRKAAKKYGPPYRIDFFGTSWRVWWTGWHVHSKNNPRVSTEDLSGHGDTLVEALDRVLAPGESRVIYEGKCQHGCPGYCDGD